ncbi:hypothetical protein QJQ45_016564 [Haematococcus lacustris]|nr:hypothetical protein QJQ45_016564 [Haematococcus lacustris]
MTIAEQFQTAVSTVRAADLPPLHLYAFKGDLQGVLTCITQGDNVSATVCMYNQNRKLVAGITPLFLAAQAGNMDVVKLLVSLRSPHPTPLSPPLPLPLLVAMLLPLQLLLKLHCISLGGVSCHQVALLNLHPWVANYLRKVAKRRKAEDKLLRMEAEAEEVTLRAAARQVAHAAAKAVQQEQQPAAPVQPQQQQDWGGEDSTDPETHTPRTPVANLEDLAAWSVAQDEPGTPPDPKAVQKLLKQVDLESWAPDSEGAGGRQQMAVSTSRRVEPVDGDTGSAAPAADPDQLLRNFLRDADLATWDPTDAPIIAMHTPQPAPATSPAPPATPIPLSPSVLAPQPPASQGGSTAAAQQSMRSVGSRHLSPQALPTPFSAQATGVLMGDSSMAQYRDTETAPPYTGLTGQPSLLDHHRYPAIAAAAAAPQGSNSAGRRDTATPSPPPGAAAKAGAGGTLVKLNSLDPQRAAARAAAAAAMSRPASTASSTAAAAAAGPLPLTSSSSGTRPASSRWPQSRPSGGDKGQGVDEGVEGRGPGRGPGGPGEADKPKVMPDMWHTHGVKEDEDAVGGWEAPVVTHSQL